MWKGHLDDNSKKTKLQLKVDILKKAIQFCPNLAFSNSGIIKFSADGPALPAKLPFGDHVKLNRQD